MDVAPPRDVDALVIAGLRIASRLFIGTAG